MSEYRLSEEAELDIGEMYRRGFWTFGELQADRFYHQLFDSLELLAEFPHKGHDASRTYPGMRRVEFTPYVIFYLVRDYGVYVVRLLKQSQVVKARHFSHSIKHEDADTEL